MTRIPAEFRATPARPPSALRRPALLLPLTLLLGLGGVAQATTIMTIQGSSHSSSFAGQSVSGVTGVVTAVAGNGFWMQDTLGDGDPATSDAIFVFRGSRNRPAVGDLVNVSGRVDEFRPGCNNCPSTHSAYFNLTATQLNSSFGSGGWSKIGTAALPAPVILGQGGRVPPSTISHAFNGNVEGAGYVFNPAAHALDFFESLEGMRVEVSQAKVVGPTNAFHEIAVLPDLGAGHGLATPRGGVVITPGRFNGGRVILDDLLIGAAAMPQASVGDRLGNTTGVLDYNFGNFKLLLTQGPTVSGANLPRAVAQPAPAGTLSVASYNVENLAGNGPQAKFDGIAGQIVHHLAAPHIVALQEMQDNDGTANAGEVAADQTYQRLIDAIVAAGGPRYRYASIDPANNADGGAPGGNIRVGYLYDPAQVSLADLRRVDPDHAAWFESRKPLAARFVVNGEEVVIINNHFNSKGGDEPLFGRFQSPALHSETQRRSQAQVLADYVNSLRTANPKLKLMVVGDLNDFQFSPPLALLEAAGLANLTETLPENARYTYIFDGNSQALDHMLVTPNLLPGAQYQILHLNSEYARHHPLRFSDHDPMLARIHLAPIPEPGTWALLLAGLGLIALAMLRRRL